MKTLDELATLIEDQGAEHKKRTDEVVASVKTLTDEVNFHSTRLRTLEDGHERAQQRMTTIEASATLLGGQIRGVSETVSRVENETKTQTGMLSELTKDKIARDAVSLAEEKRRSHVYQAIGVALALLTAIGGGVGWLVSQHEVRQPPAAVAPQH